MLQQQHKCWFETVATFLCFIQWNAKYFGVLLNTEPCFGCDKCLTTKWPFLLTCYPLVMWRLSLVLSRCLSTCIILTRVLQVALFDFLKKRVCLSIRLCVCLSGDHFASDVQQGSHSGFHSGTSSRPACKCPPPSHYVWSKDIPRGLNIFHLDDEKKKKTQNWVCCMHLKQLIFF